MNKKQFYLLQAVLKAGLAIFCISLPLWADMSNNEYGIIIAIAFSLLFAFLAFKDYKKSKLSNEEDLPYSPPANSSIAEQVSFYKRYMYISAAAFPLLTIIVIFDFNDLESGQVESVRTFAPVIFVYEQFGYWPAIFTVPILGLVCVLLFLKKIKEIKSN
jgi:hypothetical protein